MNIRYTPRAFSQLGEIIGYIHIDSPQGAKRVHARIQRAIDQLRDFPFSGGQTDDPDIRRIAATPYPHLIYCEVTTDEGRHPCYPSWRARPEKQAGTCMVMMPTRAHRSHHHLPGVYLPM